MVQGLMLPVGKTGGDGMNPIRIFISSVQKEFQQVRGDLKAFLLGDAFLKRFIDNVFLFEDLPARDQRADQVYLGEVESDCGFATVIDYTRDTYVRLSLVFRSQDANFGVFLGV